MTRKQRERSISLGYELFNELKENNPLVKIGILTSDLDDDLDEKEAEQEEDDDDDDYFSRVS